MTPGSPAQANIQRGLILLEQGRHREAEPFFREALGLEPNDAWALFHLAICQHRQDHSEEAVETILRAMRLEPNVAEFHSVHSIFLSTLGRYDEAMTSGGQALRLDPRSVQAHVAVAAAQAGLANWSGMEATAREALAIDPNDSRAANQLAQALRLQNKMAENAAQISGMLMREPENAQTHASAGWAALQKGDRKTAESHFREALRLSPASENARQGLLESFKARSPFYRLYLNYSFFMQRLDKRVRWAIIIGLYLAVRFSSVIFSGRSSFVYLTIFGAYLFFALWTHIAPAVGNLIILTDSLARHALRRSEKAMGVVAGGGIMAGLVLIPLGFLSHCRTPIIIGLALAGAAFPFRYTFGNGSKAGTWLFGIFGCCVIAVGLLALVANGVPGSIDNGTFVICVTAAALMVAGTTWLVNIPALRQRKR